MQTRLVPPPGGLFGRTRFSATANPGISVPGADAAVQADVDAYFKDLDTYHAAGITMERHVMGAVYDREGIPLGRPETAERKTLRESLKRGDEAIAKRLGVVEA